MNAGELNRLLQEEIESMLVDAGETNSYDFHFSPAGQTLYHPRGRSKRRGKTTTIGKLALQFQSCRQIRPPRSR